MTAIRKLIFVWLVFLGSFLLPSVSVAALSGTTYEQASTTTTTPETIAEHNVAETAWSGSVRLQNIVSSRTWTHVFLSRSLVVSRGGVQANRAAGKAAENITEGALRRADDFAGRQVTIETSTGQRTVIDFVTRQRGVVETKLNSARLSPGQRQLFDDIQNGRMVTPRGQRALEAGLEPGRPTTLTGCRIDHICQ